MLAPKEVELPSEIEALLDRRVAMWGLSTLLCSVYPLSSLQIATLSPICAVGVLHLQQGKMICGGSALHAKMNRET